VRSLAFSLAILIVVAVPIALVGLTASAGHWARWLYRAGGLIGVAGLVLTAVFVVNLVIPRSCSTTSIPGHTVHEVNRPILSLVLGDGSCFRSAMGAAEAATLVGVASSTVVALLDRRRRAPALR
jgi:hypothetical protein